MKVNCARILSAWAFYKLISLRKNCFTSGEPGWSHHRPRCGWWQLLCYRQVTYLTLGRIILLFTSDACCSGKFDIFVTMDGEERNVGSYDGKGSFGELALMYNMPRAATIIASTEGVLWAMVSGTCFSFSCSTFFGTSSLCTLLCSFSAGSDEFPTHRRKSGIPQETNVWEAAGEHAHAERNDGKSCVECHTMVHS